MGAVLVTVVGLIGCSGETAGSAVEADGPAGVAEGPTSAVDPGDQDAPRQVSARLWRSPSVEETASSDDPRLAAAVEVIERYFGSEDATDMSLVSTGAAHDFARFTVEMQHLAGAHPMEEVTVWTTFEIVSDDADGLRVDGRLSEDRATGSGHVERRIFENFRLVDGSDGDLLLAAFTRNDVPIAEQVMASDRLPRPAGPDGRISIEAVRRASNGVLLVAGRVRAATSPPADLLPDGVVLFDPEPHQPRFVDSRVAADGLRYFLLSFPAAVSTDQGVTLQVATGPAEAPTEVSFEIPAW